ncbi:MAG: ACT domain-containing protein [Anaerolineales bacterium]
MQYKLTLLKDTFAVHRFSPSAEIPDKALGSDCFAVVRTRDELSLLLPESVEVQSEAVERGWACFKVAGPLDFSLVGVLADISGVLARASISIFAISTYETDYVLVKREQARAAFDALLSAGFMVEREDR